MQVIAATNVESGEPIIAFVGAKDAKSSKSTILKVPNSLILSRPRSLSLDEACTLPYYAVGLLPALMKAGIHGPDAEPASSKCCVVTGAGPHAIMAIQVRKGVSSSVQLSF